MDEEFEQLGGQEEREVTCPYCWQAITVLLDTSAESQTFVEDCRVCCQPIQFSYSAQDGAITEFSHERAQ